MEHATESEVAEAAKHLRSLSQGLNRVLFGQEEIIELELDEKETRTLELIKQMHSGIMLHGWFHR